MLRGRYTLAIVSPDAEEARLLEILRGCLERANAARNALSDSENRKLVSDLEIANMERDKAVAALQAYQRRKRALLDSE